MSGPQLITEEMLVIFKTHQVLEAHFDENVPERACTVAVRESDMPNAQLAINSVLATESGKSIGWYLKGRPNDEILTPTGWIAPPPSRESIIQGCLPNFELSQNPETGVYTLLVDHVDKANGADAIKRVMLRLGDSFDNWLLETRPEPLPEEPAPEPTP